MAIHRGSSRPKLPPTVVPQAATNYNQNQFTASAYVTANGYDTTVYFDYSTSSSFSPGTYSTVTHWVTVTVGPYYAYYNTTGLTPNTTYYYRCRAVNAIGTTIGATNSFTTWSLKTYINTTAGSYSVSVPSITPYLGSTIAPTIYEMLIYGGGGGANYGGGGGGGYRIASSKLSSTAGTQNVTGTVGAAGAAGNGGTGTGTATAGGSTTLTIGSTTYTAGGGGAGQHPGDCGNPYGNGGAVGSGDNAAYTGGGNTYGWYRVCSQTYICTSVDPKTGICTGGYYQDNYCWDCGYYACGGGGGTDGYGQSAYTHNTNSQVGGAGGNGGGAYGLNGGSGGGGYGTQGTGSPGTVVAGGTTCGRGGTSFAAGQAGGVTFKYYGP